MTPCLEELSYTDDEELRISGSGDLESNENQWEPVLPGELPKEKLEHTEPTFDYEANSALTKEMADIAFEKVNCRMWIRQSGDAHYNISHVFELSDNAQFEVSELLHGKERLQNRSGFKDLSINFHSLRASCEFRSKHF